MNASSRPLFNLALTAEAMREADRIAIEDIGIPGFTLMESAGRAAVSHIQNKFGPIDGQSIACLCGKGNNGGDGLVVARTLLALGANVTIYLMADRNGLSPEAAQNLDILTKLQQHDAHLPLKIQVINQAPSLPETTEFYLLIDGLLGTGVTRTLSDKYLQVVSWVNAQPAPVVALDLPTGLHADTGVVLGDAIHATLTVTMGALKTGLLLGEGPMYAGDIEVAEIGIPPAAIQEAGKRHPSTYVVTRDAVKSWLPERKHNAHKYSVGMSLVVAGSPGLSGAATLAATAAARSGAGAVICATSRDIQDLLATKFTEIMTLGLHTTEAGISSADAHDVLKKPLEKATSLLLGCGMGQAPATQEFIRNLACNTDLPTVIDADGLNAFADYTELFTEYAGGNWILTPHLGEFKRLAGEDVDLSNRLDTVRHFARQWNCILVLKGAPTLVGDADGNVFVNPTINPALATAGSGDVLAGLCAGFLSQGLSPVQAALSALFLGGAAADRYTASHHPATLFASDLIDEFIHVLQDFN